MYWEDDEGDRIGCTKLSIAASRLAGRPLSPSDTGASLAAFSCGCLLILFVISFGPSVGFLGLLLLVELFEGLSGSLFMFPAVSTSVRRFLGRRCGSGSRSARGRLRGEA